TRRVWVSRMADNTQHAIFGKRTGSPGLLPFCCKPFMRPMVLNVGGIDQGNQHIDIKQKSAHGSSSRSWFTNSDVTRRAPLRTLRSGTPLRVLTLDSVGASARLAKQEIISPIDFFSRAANSLAALNTSSSIRRVVRIISSIIKHQTSDVNFGNSGNSGNGVRLDCREPLF